MKCSKCGAELLSGNDKFCSNCGQKVEPINEGIPNEEKNAEASVILNTTINQREQANASNQNTDNSHDNENDKVSGIWNRLSSYGKCIAIALVLFTLLCLIAFLFGKIFAGVIAIIQFVLILAALLIKKQIIKTPKSWLNVLAIVLAVVLLIPYGALLFNNGSNKAEPTNNSNIPQNTEPIGVNITQKTEPPAISMTEVTQTQTEITENSITSQEITSSVYEAQVEVICDENLIFSKYNVNVYIDDLFVGTILHGNTDTFTDFLISGVHKIKFASEEDESVMGEVQINISKDDFFRFNIHCTALEILVYDLLNETETAEETNEPITKDNTLQTTEPQNIKISEYEKAFVSKKTEYDIYYMFDVDNKTVINFVTNDTSITKGTYSGDFAAGVTMTWEAGGDIWTEKFIYKEGDSTAVWIDYSGFEYPDYEFCDVETAQSILDKLGR